MEHYSARASIALLLTLARDWLKKTAQRNQEEQTAMALAKGDAKQTGSVRPELARSDFVLLCKESKTENPRN